MSGCCRCWKATGPTDRLSSERYVVRITGIDRNRAASERPLRRLRDFLIRCDLDQRLSPVHLLPCFPDTPLEQHLRRFLTSQAVLLGLPGIYSHSLVGAGNFVV